MDKSVDDVNSRKELSEYMKRQNYFIMQSKIIWRERSDNVFNNINTIN